MGCLEVEQLRGWKWVIPLCFRRHWSTQTAPSRMVYMESNKIWRGRTVCFSLTFLRGHSCLGTTVDWSSSLLSLQPQRKINTAKYFGVGCPRISWELSNRKVQQSFRYLFVHSFTYLKWTYNLKYSTHYGLLRVIISHGRTRASATVLRPPKSPIVSHRVVVHCQRRGLILTILWLMVRRPPQTHLSTWLEW